jgi:hypothetical protein
MQHRHWPRWGAAALGIVSLLTFGAAPVGARSLSGAAAGATSATSATPTLGSVSPSGSGSLSNLPANTSSGSVHSFNSTGRVNLSGATPTGGQQPSRAAALPTTSAHPLSSNGKLLHSFDGVSDLDNTSQGVILAPPDQGLCEGPLASFGQNVVIEPVNITLKFFSTSGTDFLGPIPLYLLFGEPSGEFLSDPRCHFDAATGDFFFTVLAIDSNTASHFDVTVLHQSGVFYVYRFDSTDPGGRGCPCFADQPLLGMDSQNLYVSGNEFPIAQPSPIFNGAEIWAISKSQLASPPASVNFAEFPNISDGGILIETLQPAITDSSAPAEYFLHSFVVDATGNNSTFDNRLGIFAMTNQSAVSAGGLPTLSAPTIINSEAYVQPNLALQPSSANPDLNPDDDRMQQVQYVNGSLYGALSTAVSIKGDGTRTGIAWFKIKPSLKGSLTVKASIVKQGYVGAAGTYLLYPAIETNFQGVSEIAFSLSSPTPGAGNPSAAYVVGKMGGSGFGPVFVAATGNGPYFDDFTCGGGFPPGCRWGDYSYAVFDASTDEIWMGSEYIPPVSRQYPDANWGTRVYEVKA